MTYYGISSTAATLQAPANLSAAPVHSHMTSQIGLSWTDNSSTETGYLVELRLMPLLRQFVPSQPLAVLTFNRATICLSVILFGLTKCLTDMILCR